MFKAILVLILIVAQQVVAESRVNLEKVETLQSLTQGHFELYKRPNFSHDTGALHSQMYRTWHNGKSYLIKTLMRGSVGHGGDRLFFKTVVGMLSAEDIGGPKLRRAGGIVDEHGVTGYYFEMEELFPGDRSTFTFKGLFNGYSRFRRYFGKTYLREAQLKSVGRLLRLALERKFEVSYDFDLIFSQRSNAVYWIDTTKWVNLPDVDLTRLKQHTTISVLKGYLAILGTFYRIEPAYGIAVYKALASEIEASQIWSVTGKEKLKDNIKAGLLLNHHWKESDFKDCATFLR